MDNAGDLSPTKRELKGVEGWLLLFCVGQVIISPINTARIISNTWDQLGPGTFPVVRQLMIIQMVTLLAITAYGMIIGTLLFRLHPRGRFLARQYLVISAMTNLLSNGLVLVWAWMFSEAMFKNVAVAVIPITVLEMVVYFVWWCYFTRSKRVQNTFPDVSKAVAETSPA